MVDGDGDGKWGRYRREIESGRMDDGSDRWGNGDGKERWEKDRIGKCKMCSSNWKVESSGRSTKGSGGVEDTNLQNREEGSLLLFC